MFDIALTCFRGKEAIGLWRARVILSVRFLLLLTSGPGLHITISAGRGFLSEYGIYLFEFLIIRGLMLNCFSTLNCYS